MNENNNENLVTQSKNSLLKEIILTSIITIIVCIATTLLIYFVGIYNKQSNLIEITYSKDKTLSFEKSFFISVLGFGILQICLDSILYFTIKPSGNKPEIGNKSKWLICYLLLSLFGYLAFVVLNILLTGWSISGIISTIISSIAVSVYEYLIYKLYLEKRTYSNHIFWELFRFAIVGLVAAVFDFIVCFVVQFVFFKNNNGNYITIISTICGFIIGVIINYLMSTYMVYKASKSNLSKSFKGIIIFVVLSAIGLGIGIGVQYFLYDYLFVTKGISFLSYPVDFVIRTLIVMVYNYISRKIIIYR